MINDDDRNDDFASPSSAVPHHLLVILLGCDTGDDDVNRVDDKDGDGDDDRGDDDRGDDNDDDDDDNDDDDGGGDFADNAINPCLLIQILFPATNICIELYLRSNWTKTNNDCDDEPLIIS